jgi:hypothetical protein
MSLNVAATPAGSVTLVQALLVVVDCVKEAMLDLYRNPPVVGVVLGVPAVEYDPPAANRLCDVAAMP